MKFSLLCIESYVDLNKLEPELKKDTEFIGNAKLLYRCKLTWEFSTKSKNVSIICGWAGYMVTYGGVMGVWIFPTKSAFDLQYTLKITGIIQEYHTLMIPLV